MYLLQLYLLLVLGSCFFDFEKYTLNRTGCYRKETKTLGTLQQRGVCLFEFLIWSSLWSQVVHTTVECGHPFIHSFSVKCCFVLFRDAGVYPSSHRGRGCNTPSPSELNVYVFELWEETQLENTHSQRSQARFRPRTFLLRGNRIFHKN